MKYFNFNEVDEKSVEQIERIIISMQKQLDTMDVSLQSKCKEQAKIYVTDLLKYFK